MGYTVIESFIACLLYTSIVLPEGNDERILEAAQETLAQGIANIIILGDADEIAAKGYNLEGDVYKKQGAVWTAPVPESSVT